MEGEIQNTICEYLSIKKYFFYRSNNIPVYDSKRKSYRALPKFTMKGIPDITLIKDGIYIGLEVKKPKPNKTYQSPAQKEFQEKLESVGGKYYVVRSLDDVIEIGL